MKLLRFSCVALLTYCSAGRFEPVFADTTNLFLVADTSLHEAFPDNNFGSGTTFVSGGRNMGGRARALLFFGIDGRLPAGATVNSASLSVNVLNANGPNSTFDLHRILASWSEGTGSDMNQGSPASTNETTWNDRLVPDTPWMLAGGDFSETVSSSQAVAGTGGYTFSGPGLTADVQMWLDNPGTNFGWLLRSQTESTNGTIRRFAGRLATVNPPKLVVDYTVPGSPAVPPNLFDFALTEGRIRFSFNAESNRTYAVEFQDSLTSGSWNILTNIAALTAAATLHITNTITGIERYFRAQTP